MDNSPLSTREMLRIFFPRWVVDLFGPYADEVGLFPLLVKWWCLSAAWMLTMISLVPTESLSRYANALLAFGCFLAPAGAAILWTNRRQ